jgi:hypothetical protein
MGGSFFNVGHEQASIGQPTGLLIGQPTGPSPLLLPRREGRKMRDTPCCKG